MRKTIIAYILSCIEEISDDATLGMEVRSLQEKIFDEATKNPDDLLNILFLYTVVFDNNEYLGFEIRNIYNEIKYFFDEYTTDTTGNSN